MKKLETIEYEGQDYFDDRIFVLYLCKGTVEIEPGPDGAVWTRIYHESAPENHIWCVVTYRNCNRYPLFRVDSFYKKKDAEQYIEGIEPKTPLISLGGNSPETPVSYDTYLKFKTDNDYKDYDWASLYSVEGTNPSESVGQTKEQFEGIK